MQLKKCRIGAAVMAGLALACVFSASAQAAAPQAQPTLSWEDAIRSGGWPMIVLAGLSVLMLAMALYFLAALRVRPIASPALRRELLEKIRAGELAEARHACDYRRCPLSSIVLAALDYMRNVGRPDPMLLKEVVQGEGQRQALAIEGQVQHLQDIAVIAPMVGLLGTVLGLLRAFSSLALNIAQAQPVVLAEGISQALVTTAFGLIVGILAMIFHSWFKRRAGNLISHLELASTEALTALSNGQWKTAAGETP